MRLRRQRDRPMARRPGERTVVLSPSSRRIAGWLAAIAVVGVIGFGARLIGSGGEPSPGAGDASSSVDASAARPISFGTALDPATGLVASASVTTQYRAGETFAYSVEDVDPPSVVNVEVERVSGGPAAVVQPASPQTLEPDAAALAFTVAADALLDAFGPGEYRMRIYLPNDARPLAQGSFVLAVPAASP